MIMRSNFVCAAIALTIGMFAMTTKLLYSKLHFSLIAIAIGAVHLAAVLLNAVMIEVSMGNPGPSEALMGWLLFDLIDFPSTLLQLLIVCPCAHLCYERSFFRYFFMVSLGVPSTCCLRNW